MDEHPESDQPLWNPLMKAGTIILLGGLAVLASQSSNAAKKNSDIIGDTSVITASPFAPGYQQDWNTLQNVPTPAQFAASATPSLMTGPLASTINPPSTNPIDLGNPSTGFLTGGNGANAPQHSIGNSPAQYNAWKKAGKPPLDQYGQYNG
jgi:hypothetical protein